MTKGGQIYFTIYTQSGRYSYETVKELDNELQQNYFHREGSWYHVDRGVKAMVTFGYHDLTNSHASGPAQGLFASYDLIFCRNLLMYYNQKVQAQILRHLLDMLNNPGYLVLGKAETLPPALLHKAVEVRQGTRIYQKRY